MKKALSVLLALCMLAGLVLTGCDGEPAADSGNTGEGKIKVVLMANGGLGDRSFNDSAWVGVQKAEKDFGVEISVLEPKTVAEYGTALVSAVNSGADLILGFSNAWADPFKEYCAQYPEVYFGGLNANGVSADNLCMAMTSDHEGSFLAGALAAMMSKTGTIGAVGGQESDNINRFLVGYEEGAKYVNPDITVLKSYVGDFADPAKGKEFALQLMNQGADVIYQVASKTGEGVFEAVKENDGVYAIGVDSDQDYIVEGKILSSMVKNCDVVAYNMIESVVNGTFEAGTVIYNVANNGVGLSPMTYTKDLIGEENLKKLDEIKEKIESGEIKVTDVFEK